MELKITKKDMLFLIATTIFLFVVAILGRLVFGREVLFFLPLVAILPLIVLILNIYRRLSHQNRHLENVLLQDYRQMEALFSLFYTLKPDFPLPSTRGDYATAPDFLKKLTAIILAEKPALVVEASCGVSTLVIAYCLRKIGAGKVVSLEHEAQYAAIARQNIALHGLEDIATILHAPLKEISLHGQTWWWYNIDDLKIQQPINLLVIDGPPGNIQKMSRYPALPVLQQYLNHQTTIIMDDGIRQDEQDIVHLWEKEFAPMTSEYLDLEHGAFILRKNTPANPPKH